MNSAIKKRVLVTGASGFLAAHLIKLLGGKDIEILGISDLLPESDTLSQLADFQKLDIRDASRLHHYFAENRPEIVFHLAAVTNVGFSWQHSALTYEINLIGSSNLIEAAAAMSTECRIVLLSSAELYGFQTGALDENSPLMCRSPYALSKWAMEKLAELFAHNPSLSFLTVRPFNFTGPGQSPKFVASDFARQIARIELGLAKAEIETGNLSAERDFSDVRDIARYLIELSFGPKPVLETVNLCSGTAVSVHRILDILLSYSSERIRIITDPQRFRPVDNPVLLGNTGLLTRQYNLHPQYTLEKTLGDLLDYWRQTERRLQG